MRFSTSVNRLALAALGAALAVGQALAQPAAQWPDRPVRLLVPVGAGGAADTLSRNLSNGFSQFANGQPLIVENRPGAGGTIAAAAVAREKPDGYTLFLAEVGPNAVSHALTAKLPYDPHTAFTPIIHAANLPAVVLIRPTLPYTTLADFVAAAKQQPGKFNYASAGHRQLDASVHGLPQQPGRHRAGQRGLSLGRGDADLAAARTRPTPRSSRSPPRSARSGKARFGRWPDCRCGRCRSCPTRRRPARPSPASTSQCGMASSAPAGMEPALVARINGIFNKVLQLPAVRSAIERLAGSRHRRRHAGASSTPSSRAS